MATASDIVTSAMGYIQNREDEEAVSTSDMALGIEVLNDLMFSWSTSGLRVGYQKVAASSDEVTAPDTALLAIKQGLAVQLAPFFYSAVGVDIQRRAMESEQRLRMLVQPRPAASLPPALPLGGGNRRYDGDDFHDPCDSARLYFTDNATTTSVTANDQTAINAAWITDHTSGFTASGGSLEWMGKGIAECRVRASCALSVASGTAPLYLGIARNGSLIQSSCVQGIVDADSVTLDLDFGPMGLATGDSVSLLIDEREGNTPTVTVSQATFEIEQCG